MKKYVITSEYSYYDSYDFQTVCVCDTLEKAEQLVTQFEKQKEEYLNDIYYGVHIDLSLPENANYLVESLKGFELGDSLIIKSGRGLMYIKGEYFDEEYHIKNNIEYHQTSYFYLIDFKDVKAPEYVQRFCNDKNASINITEVDYFQ